jgi:pSer/pThr/pTyr-binding forkhead associated (FHA) protein
LQDKGSTHGCVVNQKKIGTNGQTNLRNGDAIVFGKDTEVYKFVSFTKSAKPDANKN